MSKTIDGITFNSLERIGRGTRAANIVHSDIENEADLQDFVNSNEEYRNIQGILIDWNGAYLPNANPNNGSNYTVNSTGQLLSLINEMQKEIYTLTAAVIALSNK